MDKRDKPKDEKPGVKEQKEAAKQPESPGEPAKGE
jgi:hypothetical protein